ncbi:hypothetical protein M0R72_00760 [Candidatus Pacearchaeota archaeon]|jgi:hypothetical protein|nr:hypothetical protein [Candidatus Pacearchaeota archaeon]
MITHETPAEALDSMMSMTRTLGAAQWRQLGEDASNDGAAWLGCIDRAIEAVKVKDIANAEDNLWLAHEIESNWKTFNEVALRIIRVLEQLHSPESLENYLLNGV